MGQEFSTSSKCCCDKYARTTCGPTPADNKSTSTSSQQLFQFRVGEKIAQDFRIEVTLAAEIAVEAAMGEACSSHDLGDRNIFKTAAIEQAWRMSQRESCDPAKYDLEHILSAWLDAGIAGRNSGERYERT
jgi:hypothetical protein